MYMQVIDSLKVRGLRLFICTSCTAGIIIIFALHPQFLKDPCPPRTPLGTLNYTPQCTSALTHGSVGCFLRVVQHNSLAVRGGGWIQPLYAS